MASEYTLGDIAKIINGKIHSDNDDISIQQLILDSRKYHINHNQLFFALRGTNHDGHDFIADLYKKGLRNFVVEEIPSSDFPEAHYIQVKDTLKALQDLAGGIRSQSSARIIGITGSNGKTIVKEWLAFLLQDYYKVTRNPGSYNSQVGVPLSLWELEKNDDLGIFEAGISRPDEMFHLEKMLEPEMGIITNIGSAHDQFFASRKEKAIEKLLLFKNSEKVIYCMDDLVLGELLKGESQSKYLGWSQNNSDALLYIERVIYRSDGCAIIGLYRGERLELDIPFSDKASLENAIHCWLFMLEMGLDHKLMAPKFLQLQAVAMRLEMKSGRKNSLIINDTYNSDLESLNIALSFLNQQAQMRSKVVVLSDILQTGIPLEDLYKRVHDIIAPYEVSEFVGIGPDIFSQRHLFVEKASFYESTDDFLRDSHKFNWEDSAILLKGSRPFQFEKISRKIENKTHETVLEIHLARLVHNLNYYRAKLDDGVKIMAMVKAFSYGSGSYEIAGLLQFHKVDYLAVAYTDEGVELRKAGITLPILVLNAEPSSFEDIIEYQLEPEIYNFRILNTFNEVLAKHAENQHFPIHLKLDTGMHRLGFEEPEIAILANWLAENDSVKVASVFSHLAVADDNFKRNYTEGQINLFRKMTATLEESIGPVCKHILNSSGIENFPKAQFDMVRLGIGLYGITANTDQRKYLQPVSDLMATVSQVKKLKTGDSVGYGLSFKAGKPMTIAVITIGYADGFRRSLSNGTGSVFIRGERHKVIGKVCMDMAMVDITGSDVQEGDEVEIFGPHISLYDLARQMNTIPYEVLTGVSQRVKRVYFME